MNYRIRETLLSEKMYKQAVFLTAMLKVNFRYSEVSQDTIDELKQNFNSYIKSLQEIADLEGSSDED